MTHQRRTPLIATFRPQTWFNDYAVNTGTPVEFDATAAFLRLPLDRIRAFKENDYDSDELADELPEYKSHNGPYEVDTDIDEWLADNGIDTGREHLTIEQLEELRQRFSDLIASAEPQPRKRLAYNFRDEDGAFIEGGSGDVEEVAEAAANFVRLHGGDPGAETDGEPPHQQGGRITFWVVHLKGKS